ncbi:hypothetical protein MRX96_042266 [Rhipicephalus microplus]
MESQHSYNFSSCTAKAARIYNEILGALLARPLDESISQNNGRATRTPGNIVAAAQRRSSTHTNTQSSFQLSGTSLQKKSELRAVRCIGAVSASERKRTRRRGLSDEPGCGGDGSPSKYTWRRKARSTWQAYRADAHRRYTFAPQSPTEDAPRRSPTLAAASGRQSGQRRSSRVNSGGHFSSHSNAIFAGGAPRGTRRQNKEAPPPPPKPTKDDRPWRSRIEGALGSSANRYTREGPVAGRVYCRNCDAAARACAGAVKGGLA